MYWETFYLKKSGNAKWIIPMLQTFFFFLHLIYLVLFLGFLFPFIWVYFVLELFIIYVSTRLVRELMLK